MNCCQCQGIESLFDQKMAMRELKDYRKKGPSKTTRMLLDALKGAGVEGKTLLDIGGGVGAIQHILVKAGVKRVINVDASTAYLNVAKIEATRQSYVDQASYHHGNFVDLAAEVETSDVVTLDRVLCCYPDMEALVNLSAARAGQLYGLVYPRDIWWMKLVRPLFNTIFRVQGNPFRIFIHASDDVDEVVSRQGLKRCFYRQTFIWQIVVYERRA